MDIISKEHIHEHGDMTKLEMASHIADLLQWAVDTATHENKALETLSFVYHDREYAGKEAIRVYATLKQY